jgi:hypothetical protein
MEQAMPVEIIALTNAPAFPHYEQIGICPQLNMDKMV